MIDGLDTDTNGRLEVTQISPRLRVSAFYVYGVRFCGEYTHETLFHACDVISAAGPRFEMASRAFSPISACPETDWPYLIDKFADEPKNPPSYDVGKVVLYKRVIQNPAQMKSCLASGFPFVFGFTVYESFESDQVARQEMSRCRPPGSRRSEDMRYLQSDMTTPIRDSSSGIHGAPSWGIKGYFTMPYAYMTQRDLADDFWTIRLVTQQEAMAA